MKFFRTVFQLFSFSPIVFLVMLYSFVIVGWVYFGHFPIPLRDDPKYIGMPFYWEGISVAWMTCAYGLIPYLCLAIVIRKFSKPFPFNSFICFCAGLGWMFFQLFADPFDIITWYLD